MERDVAARAFEPFFTRIYPEPGLGTTFTVLLPATDAPVPGQPDQPAAEPRGGGGETILVVEDEPAILEVARRILTEHDYVVLTASGGAEALRIATEHAGDTAATLLMRVRETLDSRLPR